MFETDQPIVYHLSLIQLMRLDVTGGVQVDRDHLAVTALDLVAEGTAQIELAGTADQQTVLLSQPASTPRLSWRAEWHPSRWPSVSS